MTPEELTRIEHSLAVQLPGFYRAFLVSYPDDLASTYTYFASDHRQHIARFQLNDSAAEIIEINRDVRRPGTPWTEEDGPWPPRYFAIGHDQCGGYFAIDLQTGIEAVFYYDHETGCFAAEHESLAAFAAQLIAEAREWNAKHEPTGSVAALPPAATSADPNQLSLL